jgi:dolichol-phosphate mannosyltransferase
MNLGKVLFQAVNSILGYTSAPLVWVSIIGACLSGISLLLTAIFSIIWITKSVPFAGFGTIVGLISLGFSSLLFAIGVIAQYISLIYEEVKARPIYIIDQTSIQTPRESEN